jgi:hypothetical protein
MRYTLLLLLIIWGCNQPKKEKKETEIIKTEKKAKEDKVVIENVKEKVIIKTQEELLIVLKNPKKVVDAKALIENSGLVWENLIINKNTLKVAIIKVPIDKKKFWIERLKEAAIFSSVELNSVNSIETIKSNADKIFVKINKNQCSGDCPVYDLVVLKDGKVLFNGIKNVLILGKQEFTISDIKMKNIKDTFEKTSFNTYLDSYVDQSLMDYPSTFITYNDKQIEIKLWKDVPDELAFAYEIIEDILFEKKLVE